MSAPLINLEIEQPEDVTERRHRQFMNHALRAAATHHLLQFAPDHFETGPKTTRGGAWGQIYGFRQRTKKHQLRKARKFGHQRPNVFSGRERAYVLANARVTATYQKSRVVYRSLHTRTQEESDRWVREMSVVTIPERAVGRKIAHDAYMQKLTEFRATRVRKRIS